MTRWLALVFFVACATPLHRERDDNDDSEGGEAGASGGADASGGSGGSSGGAKGSTGGSNQAGTMGSGAESGEGGETSGGGTGNAAGRAGSGASGGTRGGTGAGGEDPEGEGGTGGFAGVSGGSGGTSGSAGEGSGGTAGTGGTAGSNAGNGGSAGDDTVTCSTHSMSGDGYVLMPATGDSCWHGYAYAGGDAQSNVVPETFSTCGTACSLSITGQVNAATEANEYAGVVYLGFALNQARGSSSKGTVTPTGTGIALAHLSTGPKPVRLTLKGSTNYCVTLTTQGTGVQIPYTTFSTDCVGTGNGTAYARQPISEIQAVMPGGSVPATFTITMGSLGEY